MKETRLERKFVFSQQEVFDGSGALASANFFFSFRFEWDFHQSAL